MRSLVWFDMKRNKQNVPGFWTPWSQSQWEFGLSNEFRIQPRWKRMCCASRFCCATHWVVLSATELLIKPVISHAVPVPLQSTVPAPLKSALRSRTFHVHASTYRKKEPEYCWCLANNVMRTWISPLTYGDWKLIFKELDQWLSARMLQQPGWLEILSGGPQDAT